MNKILVPTDFSDCANNAKNAALEIAKRNGAEIHFLHSVNTPVDWREFEAYTRRGTIPFSGGSMKDLYPEFKTAVGAIEEKMGALEKEAKDLGLEAKRHLEYNYSYLDIIRYAEDLGADLMVMGSHGASGLNEMFIGSITQKVVRSAEMPVLVVKGDSDLSTAKNFVFCSDFEEEQVQGAMDDLIKFVKIFNAKAHLLYVNTPNHFDDTEFTLNKMNDFIAKYDDVQFEKHVWNEYTVEDGIISFARNNEVDLVATATHGFKGLRRMIHVNVTENLINHSEKPVLCLNIRR